MKNKSNYKKWFWGIVAGCVVGIVLGINSVLKDSSDEKAEWSDSIISTETVEGREADSETKGNDNSVNESKPASNEASPFKDNRVIVDYDYGACNNGCGCTQYAHYPGRKACVNCAKHDCPTSKYDHERKN